MKRDNKLKLHYNKKINDIEGMLPLSETRGRWDVYLLFYHFISRKASDNNKNLIEELEERGYDLTSLKFSIEKATDGYTPVAHKIGMHFKPDFNSCLIELRGYNYKLTVFDKENKTLVFERKHLDKTTSKIIYKVSKYNTYYFETENVKVDKYILSKIENVLRFLEDIKFENLDIDMEYIYETIYEEF